MKEINKTVGWGLFAVLVCVFVLGLVIAFKITTTPFNLEAIKYWMDIQSWLNLIESVALILLLYLLASEVFKE